MEEVCLMLPIESMDRHYVVVVLLLPARFAHFNSVVIAQISYA